MKKHHSIFGTKSIPDYRKQEFRNRRNASRMPRALDVDGYNGQVDYNDQDNSYTDEPEKIDDSVNGVNPENRYDSVNGVNPENRDDSVNGVDPENRDDSVNRVDFGKSGDLVNSDDLEHAIYKTAEEMSGSYQNIDDTVLINAASISKNLESSESDFPIDFLDDEISDDTRDFDNEYDEYDEDIQDAQDESSYKDYESDEYEDYLEDTESDGHEDYLEDAESDGYEDYLEDAESDGYEDYLEDAESDGYDDYQQEPVPVGETYYDDIESDLREEEEKSVSKRSSSKNAQGTSVRSRSHGKAVAPVRNGSRGKRRAKVYSCSNRRRPAKQRKRKQDNNIILFLKNSNALEKMSMAIGLVVIITGVALGSLIIRTKARADEISSFSNVGCEIAEMQVPGSSGLVAVADAQEAKKAAAEAVSEAASAATTQEEQNGVKVNLSLASIKQDLKIKFLNSESARLISGVPFEVEIKKPDGSTTTWKDEDKDGIIYHYDIPAGTYTVTMKELSGDDYNDYTFNTKSQTIEVKENIEYKAVDVSDEVKEESEVNVAVEDTVVQETVVESQNTDTVEWVESTKTEIGSSGEVSYEEIKKDTIVNPYSAKGIIDADSLQLITSSDNASTENTSSSAESSTVSSNASTTATTSSENNNGSGDDTSDTGNTGSGDTNSESSDSGGSNTGGTTENSSEESTKETKTYTYSISTTQATIKVGESINISISPNHDGLSVTWGSSDPSVATVSSENGTTITVTGKKDGNATITAKPNDSSESLIAKITVKGYTYSISKETLSLKAGSSEKLTATTDYSDTSVTWSTSNEKVATVASDGTVTAVAEGTAKVTATFKDGTTKVCTVTVSKSGAKIELSSSKATIIVGGTALTLTAKVTGLTDTTVTWKSADESIATVDNGKVTGKKAGTVKITATSKADTSVTATCEVTVKDGAGELKDKSGNVVYVTENGSYRKATIADYDKASKFFIQKEGKLYKYTGWQTIEGYTYYYDKDGNFVTGDQVIQGAKYSFGSDGRLSTGSGTLGIDVSKWNGSIDWSQVKNSGVSYVIIRCGYRGSSTGALIEDPKFRANISGATSAGLKVGVYFFTQAITDVEAVEEASMVISLIKGYNISCPVFLDVEAAHGRADGISVATRTAVCKSFCATIKNAGYTAGIYANKTWLNSYIDAPSLTGYKIWLAQYAATPTYTRTRYDMWQYTSSGSIAGISGRVDMNISYMGF